MASLNTQDFDTLVRNMAAAVQSAASTIVDMTVGSVVRAVCESVAGVVLWLQALIVQVLALTRAATSTGSDLDSWQADFGYERLGANAATGLVTFSRFTAAAQAVVPIGATVQTADGTQTFAVTIDASNAAYSAAAGGYVVAAGVSSVTVPVKANTAGTAGNVLGGAVNTIGSSIAGIDTVTNAAAFTNGVDAALDPAARSGFVIWIASLSKATKDAITNAVTSVQQGLQVNIIENQNYDGTTDYGFFCAIIDDGTGTPSTTLLNTCAAAIEAVRGLSIRYGVFAPVVVTAIPAMTITSAVGYVHATVLANVAAALQTAINALPLGTSLPYTQLSAIAYSVDGVANVTSITLNGATSDLTATAKQVIKCGTPVVN